MNKFIVIATAVVAAAGLCEPARAEMSLDVSPIRVTVRMEAGEDYTNALRVLNSGKDPVRLRAYLEDWDLDEVGTPIFRPAGTLNRTASPWVDVAPADFLLEPGQTEFVRFTIRVPKDVMEAGYHGTILLETLPLNRAESGQRQMFVQGRIACMMYVTVGNPSKTAAITELTTIRRDGQNYLRVQVANTGDDFIRLAGDMTVRRGDETVNEGTALPDVPVLPGSRRWLELELSPELMAADLLARINIDIADVGVLIGECPLDPSKVQLAQ
jgi:P pilus assembly chaperone PapD